MPKANRVVSPLRCCRLGGGVGTLRCRAKLQVMVAAAPATALQTLSAVSGSPKAAVVEGDRRVTGCSAPQV